MPAFFTFLFSLLVGGLLLLVAVLLRRSASALADDSPTPQFPRAAIQVAGAVFALGGTIGLLMILCIFLAVIDQHRVWPTQIPSTVGVALALCVAVGAGLVQWSASRSGMAATEPVVFRSWRTPIGAVTITCVGLALLSVLMMVLFDLIVNPPNGGPPPSILVLFSVVPLVLVLTGLALLRSADFLVPPTANRTGAERQALIRALRNLSILYLVLGAFAALIIGVPVLIVMGLLALSTMAARHQAARLGALWVLARTLRSSRPLADELTAHAECSTGRMSRLLKRAARDLDEGLPLAQVLYHDGIVPKNSLLQAAGGLSSGQLPEALRAAAARETTRFAASSRPYGRQFISAYAAALFMVMWLIIAFLMYYIVPKFKKIFEDFDLELPAATITLIQVSDAYVNYWYILFPFLPGLFVAALAAEAYAMYFGWAELWERLLGGRWLRLRTPDLLRGLKWAVIAQRPLDQALQQMASVPLPLPQRTRLENAARRIEQGDDPWIALHEQGWLTSPEAELLRNAQQNDHLAWALEKLSDSSQATREFRMAAIAECIHPAVVIFAGVIVGCVVYAFFVPLIHMIEMMS